MYYRNPIKIMCTIRLNDGIFTVHRFSVATSARLRKSECVFRFYVYGGIFDNLPGYFCLHVEYLWALQVPMDFWIGIGIAGLLSVSVFGLAIVGDGGLLFSRIS
jgi:hypothetical protein